MDSTIKTAILISVNIKLSPRTKIVSIGVICFIIPATASFFLFLFGVARATLFALSSGGFGMDKAEITNYINITWVFALAPFVLMPLGGLIYTWLMRRIFSVKKRIIWFILFSFSSFVPIVLFYVIITSPLAKQYTKYTIDKAFEHHEGRNVWYYDNGQLKFEEYYKNGKQHGTQKLWYENGQLMKEEYYENGKRNGTSKHWHENGQLRSIAFYVSGEPEGEHKVYNEQGKLTYDLDYVKGFAIYCRVAPEVKWCNEHKNINISPPIQNATPSGSL